MYTTVRKKRNYIYVYIYIFIYTIRRKKNIKKITKEKEKILKESSRLTLYAFEGF